MSEKGRILFVDDEKDFAEAMSQVLRMEGYTVETAFSGSKAIDIFQSRKFDLVITDLKMPELDGIELIRLIRQLRPDQCIVVITAFSSQIMPWNRRLLSDQGQEEIGELFYLVKPFTTERLVETVEKYMPTERTPGIKSEARASGELQPVPASKETGKKEERDDLKQILVDTARAIGGKVACALVGKTGKLLAEANPGDFPTDRFSGKFALLMWFVRNTLSDVGACHLTENLLCSGEEWILARFLSDGKHYLSILTDANVALGTLRAIANETVRKLENVLGEEK